MLFDDSYDPLDRLSIVTWPDGSTLSITYDPLGLRNEEVLKNSSGTVIADNRLLWLGGKIISEGTNNYWSSGYQEKVRSDRPILSPSRRRERRVERRWIHPQELTRCAPANRLTRC